jgi:copper chaperone CopZ
MQTLKYKTNIKCSACLAKVTPALNETVGEGKWSVDLTHPARILTVLGEPDESRIKTELEKTGYKAERI